MNQSYFENKIKKLDDQQIVKLLELTNNNFNQNLFNLVKDEATKRNLSSYTNTKIYFSSIESNASELNKLNKYNWPALFQQPLWSIHYKLDFWVYLLCIPGLNLFIWLYLFKYGNKLAYKNFRHLTVDEYLILQNYWMSRLMKTILVYLILMCISILFFLILRI